MALIDIIPALKIVYNPFVFIGIAVFTLIVFWFLSKIKFKLLEKV